MNKNNDENIELKIKISKKDYAMLENIAIGMSPAVYLQNFLKLRLFKGTSSENYNFEDKEKFQKLKEDLHTYGIKQADIATYFSVSQTSVSTFLKKENKKSHLYPKFFTHSTANSLIYNIYCNKYLQEYLEYFSKDKQMIIEKTFYELHNRIRDKNILNSHEEDQKQMFIEAEKEDYYSELDLHSKQQHKDNMLTIASILSVKIKNILPNFNINEFIEVVQDFGNMVIEIDHNMLKNKDLDYLDSKITYIENEILPIIAF